MSATWVLDFVDLLKYFEQIEKNVNSKRSANFREFHRSFKAGNKQYRILSVLEKIYQETSLPPSVFKQDETEKVVETEETEKVVETEEADETEKVVESTEVEEKEKMDLTWVEEFNKKNYLIKLGSKSIRLSISTVTPEYKNYLLKLFRNFNDQIIYEPKASVKKGALSQKKINGALKKIKKMDRKQLQNLKKKIPPKELEEMAADDQMREMAQTLSRRSELKEVVSKLE